MERRRNVNRNNRGRHNAGRGSSQRSDSHRPATGKVKSIEALEMLKYRVGPAVKDSNLLSWKLKLGTYCLTTFGQVAMFIETGAYPELPEIEAPPADQLTRNADPYEFTRRAHQKAVDLRMAEISEMNKKKPQIYGIIWGHISQESEDKVKADPDFEVAHREQNPLLLLNIIIRVHTNEGLNATGAIVNARKFYSSLRQYDYESVADFTKRFDLSLQVNESVGVERTDEAIVAAEFIDKLDRGRFEELQKDLHNRSLDAADDEPVYPVTLNAAYSLASNYKSTLRTSTSGQASHSVFTAPVDNRNDRHLRGGRGIGGRGAGGRDAGRGRWVVCYNCQKKGHVMKDCPQLGGHTQHAAVAFNANDSPYDSIFMAKWMRIGLGPYDVLLDNQATVSVFKSSELLRSITPLTESFSISGLAGDVEVKHEGKTKYFGLVGFCPEASANILSFSKVAELYQIIWMQDENAFDVVIADDLIFRFAYQRGLYVYTVPIMSYEKTALVTTVNENMQRYSKREVKSASLAREVMANLGYPSTKTLIDMIKAGTISDIPVTAQDVWRSEHIWGRDVNSLKGKTVQNKNVAVDIEYVGRPVDQNITLLADIMFVQGEPYLVTVAKELGLTMVNSLKSRSTAAVKEALSKQLSNYTSRGFIVRTLLTDGEGAVHACTLWLNQQGVTVNPAGPGKHVPVVERKIRLIKERIRCHRLPFRINKSLYMWLVLYCVHMINLEPNNKRIDVSCPRELFTGQKTNYKKHARIGFGQYVQLHPRETSNSVDVERSSGAIALMPLGNAEGSYRFLHLKTRSVVTRDHWTSLPMPDFVIDLLNNLGADAGELNIEYRGAAVSDAEEEPVEVDTAIPPQHVPDIVDDDVPINVNTNAELDITGVEVTEPELEPELAPEIIDHECPTSTVLDKSEHGEDSVEIEDLVGDAAADEEHQEEGSRRYPLRGNRGNWKEYGLHISVKSAMKQFGDVATTSSLTTELKTLHERGTWEPVMWSQLSNAQKKSVIRSFIFLKDKYLADSTFEKLKSRLVGGGHMQDRGLYGNVASPTGAIVSLFIIAIIAIFEKRKVATADIASAYINADMDVEVFMRIDKECSSILCKIESSYLKYLNHDGSLVVKLKKALYGCIQSALLWYRELSTFLISKGFIANPYDECVFNKDFAGVGQCTIFVYVDDLFVTCKSQDIIDKLFDDIQLKYREVKGSYGTVHNYLGMTFDFHEDFVKIGMQSSIEDTIRSANVQGTATTPAGNNLFNISQDSNSLNEADRDKFHSIVAKLLYIAKRVRPDILTAVSFLATRVQNPTEDDWLKLFRVLKYLNGTSNLSLFLGCTDIKSMLVFIDAAFGNHWDGKSHSGLGISWGKGLLLARSSKQKYVVKSSWEAELVAGSDECSTAIGVRNFVRAQGHDLGPVILYQDNKSTMATIKKGKHTGRNTKHVNVRYFFLKDRVEQGEVELKYLPTDDMIADGLTKPIQGALFRKHRDFMLGHLTLVVYKM